MRRCATNGSHRRVAPARASAGCCAAGPKTARRCRPSRRGRLRRRNRGRPVPACPCPVAAIAHARNRFHRWTAARRRVSRCSWMPLPADHSTLELIGQTLGVFAPATVFTFVIGVLINGPLPEELGWRGVRPRPIADEPERVGVESCPGHHSHPVASFAGTSMTSMPSARSRLVSGAPTPLAPSIAQSAMGNRRAKWRSADSPRG